MHRLALLSALLLGVAACGGGSGGSKGLAIKFGTIGGTMVPYTVTISPKGAVTLTRYPTSVRTPIKPLSTAEEGKLASLVRSNVPALQSKSCPGTFPDESSMFITALGKTVTDRGNCDSGFAQLWGELTRATGLSGSG